LGRADDEGGEVVILLLVAQLTVAPLTPAQAVAVLRASHSDRDMTDYRAAPAPELPVRVSVERRAAPVSAPPAPAVRSPTSPELPFNYADPYGRWPQLIQIVGDVSVVKK
jgi:hypothetical protein